MQQTSSAKDLKKLLQQKTQQDQEAQQQLIMSSQEKLLSDLQSMYKSELSTTLNVINDQLTSESQKLETTLTSYKAKLTQIINSQYSTAAKQVKATTDPAAASLDKLTASLNKIEKAAARTARVSRKKWIVGATVGLTLFLIICVSAWGLMHYLASQIQQSLITINEQEATIQHLLNQTSGVKIVQTKDGLFVILPKGAAGGYTLGEQQAIKLPTH